MTDIRWPDITYWREQYNNGSLEFGCESDLDAFAGFLDEVERDRIAMGKVHDIMSRVIQEHEEPF